MKSLSVKFGKLPGRIDLRTLQLKKYIRPAELPPLPPEVNWEKAVTGNWGAMRNDDLGDCTCAAAGHLVMTWTANASGAVKVIPDNDIVAAYTAVSGYNPQTGANDEGAYSIDVLKLWNNQGIGGDIISSYVQIDNHSATSLKQAIYLFGGCFIGLQLPNALRWMNGVWDIPAEGVTGDGAPNPHNGHAVPIVGYNGEGFAFITWGTLKFMTWNFYDTYCDEAYAILSPDWFEGKRAPAGFDIDTLKQDLQDLKNN
jgi:hypothetical protein